MNTMTTKMNNYVLFSAKLLLTVVLSLTLMNVALASDSKTKYAKEKAKDKGKLVIKKKNNAFRCKQNHPVGAYTIEVGPKGFQPGEGFPGNFMFNEGGTVAGGTTIDIDGPMNPFAEAGGFGLPWTGAYKNVGKNKFHILINNILVDKTDEPQFPGVIIARVKIEIDLKFDGCDFSGDFTAQLFPADNLKLENPKTEPIELEIIGTKIIE